MVEINKEKLLKFRTQNGVSQIHSVSLNADNISFETLVSGDCFKIQFRTLQTQHISAPPKLQLL